MAVLRSGWIRVPGILCLSLVSLLILTLIGLQIPAVATWTVRELVTLVPLRPGYRLEVGRVSGNWLTGLELRMVSLVRGRRPMAVVNQLRIQYNLRQLLGSEHRIDGVEVDGVTIRARRQANGWDVTQAFASSGSAGGRGGRFEVGRLELHGAELAAALGPDSLLRVQDLAVRARQLIVAKPILLDLAGLHATLLPPGQVSIPIEVAASGRLGRGIIQLRSLRIHSPRSDVRGQGVLPRSFDDPHAASQLNLELRATPLSLADISAFYPSVVPHGALRLELHASTQGRLARGTMFAQLDDASVRFAGAALLGGGPVLYRLSGAVKRFDPARLLRTAPAGPVTGMINTDLTGESLKVARGRALLRLSDSRVRGADITSLDVSAKVNRGRARVELRGSIAGARVDGAGWVRPFDSIPSYRLTGAARQIPGTEAIARTLTGASVDQKLSCDFHLAGQGVSSRRARISANARITAVSKGGGELDVGRATVRFENGRVRARPVVRVAGGRVTGLVQITLGQSIRYEIRDGVIDRVDLGRLRGDTAVAPLSGQFALEGQGTSLQQAVANGLVRLDGIRYGERRLGDLVARARLRAGAVRLTVKAGLQGGTVALEGTARPLDSPLSFSIDSAALERVDLGSFLNRPALSGPVSLHATGRGRWGSGTRVVRLRTSVARSRVGPIDVAGGRAELRLRGAQLTYDASVQTSAGSLALAGEGRTSGPTRSFRVERGRLDSLNLGKLLGRSNLTTSVNAGLAASISGAGLDSMHGQVDLQLLPSEINRARLGPGSIAFSLAQGTLKGKARVEGPDGELTAALAGKLTGDVRRIGADGTLRIEQLARWTGDTAKDGRIEGKFSLQAKADSAGLLGIGGTVTAIGGVGRVRVHSLYVLLKPRTGSIVVDTFLLRSNVLQLDGGGGVPLRGTAGGDTLRIAGRTDDVHALAQLAGIDSLSLDSSRIALALTGPPERRRLAGKVSAHRLLYSSTLAEELEADATAAAGSAGRVSISGRLRLRGVATGSVTLPDAELAARYDSLLDLEASGNLGHGVRFRLALEGAGQSDSTIVLLKRLQLVEGGRTWELTRTASVALRPKRVEVHDFALVHDRRMIALQGILALRDTSNLILRLDSVQLDAMKKAGLVPIVGTIDGSLRLLGPAGDPVVDGRLALVVRDPIKRRLAAIESGLTWNRRGLQLEVTAARGQRGELTIRGTLPWGLTLAPPDSASSMATVREPRDTLNLSVHADSFDLSLLGSMVPPQLARNLSGKLVMDATVRGTPEAPLADGTIQVPQLGLELPTLHVSYERSRLSGRLFGDVLRIDTLLLHTGKQQELTAQGEVGLRPLTNPQLKLNSELRDFMVSNSATLQAQATGRVQLAGTLRTPVVTGSLQVGHAEMQAAGTAGVPVENVTLTPEDQLQLARHFGPRVLARIGSQGGFLDRFRLDLLLRLPEQVWFRRRESPELDVELAGRVRLRQEPHGKMLLYGTVEPLAGRSTLDVYGRTFQLTGGQIALRGPPEQASINVSAEYNPPTQGGPDDNPVVIDVVARGRPDSIALDFSSQPEMSRDDIISYIVTGRPSSDNPLVAQPGGPSQGEQLALSQLSEVVSGAVSRELGLDVFQIRQDGTRGLVLTAGRYVTPHFYISLQQPLELGGQSTQDPGTSLGPAFELQYRMQPWLRFTMQGGSIPAGVLLRGRHAY